MRKKAFALLFILPVLLSAQVYCLDESCKELERSPINLITPELPDSTKGTLTGKYFRLLTKVTAPDSKVFNGRINLERSCFGQGVHIGTAEFEGELDFWKSRFCGAFKIGQKTHFHKIDLNHASFFGGIVLRKFTLEEHNLLQFKEAKLWEGGLEISDLILERDLDLSGMEFEKRDHPLRLYRVDISSVNLDYQFFRLDTAGMSNSQIEYTYEQLVKSQQEFGYIEGHKKADIEYMRYKLRNKTLGKVRDWVQLTWWTYGYERIRIVWITLLILSVIIAINTFFIQQLNDVYTVSPVKNRLENGSGKLAILNRIWLSVIYSSVIFIGLKLNIEELDISQPRSLYILLIYGKGLLCMAFILNYILVI